jgi:hypothetical protein
MFKVTANDKRNTLYDFMMDLVERSNKWKPWEMIIHS